MTEKQLLLLNNLIYQEPFTNRANEGMEIGKILDTYAPTAGNAFMSKEEWEDVYNLAKNDPQISKLTLVNTNTDDQGAGMACFVDSKGQATAVFRGTGENEWPDNVRGANSSGTDQQLAALEWFNRLGYNNITVTGHSKGGNKAMFVTLLSDKAGACYSFDGQGFSPEFLSQFADKIAAKSGQIHSIAHYRDFVNILLLSVAGDCRFIGNEIGIGSFPEYHCPNAMFQYEFNPVTKTWVINYLAGLGQEVPQDRVMAMLSDAVAHFVKNLPADKRDKTINDLAVLIEQLMRGKSDDFSLWSIPSYVDSVLSVIKSIREYLVELKKLDIEEYNLVMKDLYRLLVEMLGVDRTDAVMKFLANPESGNILLTALDTVQQNDITRDFTDATKQMLLNLVKEVEEEKWWDFTKWDCWYRIELGAKHLFGAGEYATNVNNYYKKVIDINNASAQQIEDIFTAVYAVDSSYCERTMQLHATAQNLYEELKSLTNSLAPRKSVAV